MSKSKPERLSKIDFLKRHEGYIAPSIVADSTPLSTIAHTIEGKAKIRGRLGHLKVRTSKGKPYLKIYEMTVRDSTGEIKAIWFNKPFLNYVNKNREYIFLGIVQMRYQKLTLVSPHFTTIEDVKSWTEYYKKQVTP